MPKQKPSRKPSRPSPNRPGGRRAPRHQDDRSEGWSSGKEGFAKTPWEPEGSYQASRVKRTADQARRNPGSADADAQFPGRIARGKKHPGNKNLGKGGQGQRTPLSRLSGKPIYRGGKTERIPIIKEPEKIIRFSDLLIQLARKEEPTMVGPSTSPEPLARMDYATELDLKNRALQQFWAANGLPDKPNRIAPSPKPRHYRTTTKRKVIFEKGAFHLDFMPDPRGADRMAAQSMMEPAEHTAIYAFILGKLNQPAYSQIAHALDYLVIRGDYTRFSVLFNVRQMNGNVVRKAKLLSEHLQTMDPKTASAFLFYDSGRYPFYLDQRSPEGSWKFKKLFGPDNLRLKVGDKNYAFHPTSFSQINASILPAFLEKAHQLLKARPEQRLIDLYCGYGLFSLGLAGAYKEVLGVDASGMSIQAAQSMAGSDKEIRCQFRSGRIQARNLDKLLPEPDVNTPEALLLDPPRQGTDPGVIRTLASRAPVRVLHIFCDMDVLAKEVNQWRKSGYMVAKVVPLDMYPGTDNLEVMVLFIPDRYSILNRIDKRPPEGYTGPHHNPKG